jgi:ArsR family transcriptional regulator
MAMIMAKPAPAKKKLPINYEIYERQAQICKAFANPVRLLILDLISQGEKQSAEMQEMLGITKANLSQHLTVLKSAGIILLRREGKQVFCSLAMPEVKQACELVHKVLESQWEGTRRLLKSC